MEKQFDNYTLSSALMVYVGSNGTSNDNFYVEAHKVQDGKLLEGKPLTTHSIESLIKSFLQKRKRETFSLLPTKLLALSDEIIIWFTPSQIVNLFFTGALNIPNGKASVPALLWKLVNQQRLSVYALTSDRRPNNRSKLYCAPFHNVSGSVCMGSAKIKETDGSIDNVMLTWEQAFWNSKFSHLTGGNPIKEPHNINLLWKKLIEGGKPFPKEVLKPFHVETLGELIKNCGRI